MNAAPTSPKPRSSRRSPPPMPVPRPGPGPGPDPGPGLGPSDGEVVFPPPGKWQSSHPSPPPSSPLHPESPTSRAATCNNELHCLTGQPPPAHVAAQGGCDGGVPGPYSSTGRPRSPAPPPAPATAAAAVGQKAYMCSNWPGNCVYGSQCVYAHGEHELLPAPPAYSPPPSYQEFVAYSPTAASPAAVSPQQSSPSTPRGPHLLGPVLRGSPVGDLDKDPSGVASGPPSPGYKSRYRNDPYSPTTRVEDEFGAEAE